MERLCKGCLFASLAKATGYGNVVPLAVSLALFQVGELAFVLLEMLAVVYQQDPVACGDPGGACNTPPTAGK